MRALIFRGPNDYSVEETPMPQIGEGEVLLKIIACGLCGTDVKVFTNGHRGITTLPMITGHEIVGEVTETKSSTAGVRVGDRVIVVTHVGCMSCGFCKSGFTNSCTWVTNDMRVFGFAFAGGFAEYMRVPKEAADRKSLIPIPPTSLPITAFAILEPLACVINGQEKLRITPQDTVVVVGAGPIGSMHAYIARAKGAKRIILAEKRKHRVELASQHVPADVFVNNSEEDLVERVKKETNGRGADVVILAAPDPSLQTDAMRMAANRGRISFFAGLSKGSVSPSIDTNDIHYHELEIYGAFGAGRRHYEEALQAVLEGRVNASRLITHTMPLERIAEAVRIVESGEGIKVVIVP